MLTDSKAVDEVIERLEPHLSANQLILDMSSSDPACSKAHAERMAAKGVGWVDAPVSGGPEGAAAGSLAIMAGGSVRNQLKDLLMGKDLAQAAAARLPHLESTISFYQTLIARGEGESDHSALHKLLWP